MSRLYISASRAVNMVVNENKSIKFCYTKLKMGKTDYALAYKTLLYLSVINRLLNSVSFNDNEIENKGMLYVMIYDLLFGKGKIDSGGAIKRIVVSLKPALIDALKNEMTLCDASCHEDLLSSDARVHCNFTKHIRANLIKTTVAEASAELSLITGHSLQTDSMVPSLFTDSSIPSTIVNHPWVADSRFIIQDKASCFPAQMLMDVWFDGDVIDACAAPGNKTSLMAAILHSRKSSNQIFAFDKNPRRCNLLQQRMEAAGADQIVCVQNEDFLTLDVLDPLYSNVKSLLLDPSCSGSGVVRSLERIVESSRELGVSESSEETIKLKERLSQLHSFQVSVIKKAMTFPNASMIAYSTCSIYQEENEDVVSEILRSDLGDVWELCTAPSFSSWHRRGNSHPQLSSVESQKLIRCLPEDGMNGFFVALFCKKIVNCCDNSNKVCNKNSNSNSNSIDNDNSISNSNSNVIDRTNMKNSLDGRSFEQCCRSKSRCSSSKRVLCDPVWKPESKKFRRDL